MSTPFLTSISVVVAEKSTVRLTGTVKDHTSVALAAVDTLKLTLYEKSSGTIINLRNAVSVLNVAGGTFVAGAFTMVLDPADNALLSQANGEEVHVAAFDWTYNTGLATGRALVEFTVRNFLKVT